MPQLTSGLADRILEGSPDAILVCDPAGQIRYWNGAATRIFGFSEADALGASLDLIIPERLRGRHWAGWEKVAATGVTRYAEGQLLAVPALHKDGRTLSVEFSLQLLKDADARLEWMVAVIRDVTERYTRDRTLRAELAAFRAKATAPSPAE